MLFVALLAMASGALASDVLFIGSYTDSIARYSLEVNGTLSYLGKSVVDQNPSWLTLHSNRRILFAANEIENFGGVYSGAVSSYAIQDDGSLLFLSRYFLSLTACLPHDGRVSSAGADPCHLALSPDDSTLYVSNYCSGTLSIIRVDKDGSLNEPSQVVSFGDAPTSCSEPGASHIHEVTFTGAGSVLVNDLGKNAVYRFEILADGLLREPPTNSSPIAVPGSGPRHTAIHPTAPFAFVINELSSSISSFAFDRETGSLLAELASVSTLRPTEDNTDMGAAEIQISADGRFLYGSNRDLSSPNLNRSSIVVMAIDEESGKLTPIQHADTLGEQPRHFDLFFGGALLVVGNLKSNTLLSFPVDQSSGMLGASVGQAQADSPTQVLGGGV
jgi:6-phosphogluconolactonase